MTIIEFIVGFSVVAVIVVVGGFIWAYRAMNEEEHRYDYKDKKYYPGPANDYIEFIVA